MSKLDNILERLFDSGSDYVQELSVDLHADDAKQEIKELMLELVGEDDWTDSEVRKYQVELRQKINEL